MTDRRRAWWAVGVIVAVTGALVWGAFQTVSSHETSFDARSRIVLVASPGQGWPNIGYEPGVPNMLARSVASYAVLVTSENFLLRVKDRQHLAASIEDLRKAIRVTSPKSTAIVQFDVRGTDRETARLTARAVAEEFATVIPELEKPTPIHPYVLPDVSVASAFPGSSTRITLLTLVAGFTVMGLAVYYARGPGAMDDPDPTVIPTAGGR